MPTEFVRYPPEIETFDPNLDQLMTKIIQFWETTVAESPTREGTGRAVRGAHAKRLGVVKAEASCSTTSRRLTDRASTDSRTGTTR
jgi:hypothetical protein